MNLDSNKIWDVIVIGGGPAGMMAAGTAAQNGRSVLLLEKNTGLGKKLLITGGGRCNVTNYKPEMKQLVSSYKNNPKALFSTFSQFDVEETLKFFQDFGMETKIEAEGRVFPVTDRAETVWQVMLDFIKDGAVHIKTNEAVKSITKKENLFTIKTKNYELTSKSCIVATGGTSHPETGSTGDGYKWLKNLGHTIIDNSFALVPIAVKDDWVKKLSGVSLTDIKISIIQDNKKIESKNGKILFTHFGFTGPTVLNLSSKVGDLLQYGDVEIHIDLLPEVNNEILKEELNKLLLDQINKKIKNTLNQLIPSSISGNVLQVAGVDVEKKNHSITRDEKKNLLRIIKALPIHVNHLLGADKAVVSAGGVDINEVNFKTMQSRIVPGLFIIGDVLNIDRPSGGYSLQICWSTGYVAGKNS